MEPLYGLAQIHRDRAEEKSQLEARGYPASHPAHLFFETCVPRVYRSVEEIEEWRGRFGENVSRIENARFSPMEGLQALRYLNTFGIGYQQRNDRDLLSRLNRAIVEKIHRPFMPQHADPLPRKRRHRRLRVGYISENMNASNFASWALGWMSNHGRDIETYAFSIATQRDGTEKLYRRAVNEYVQLGSSLPADIQRIASYQLDVLIFTDVIGPTIQYFAGLRLAPVQCMGWGHPVTSGFPTIDYFLSSELMEPVDGDAHYSETLVRLPGTSLCRIPQALSPSTRSKADFGLDGGALLLTCQSAMKYLPQHDEIFARICEATGRPIVFAPGFAETLAPAMRSRMEAAGVRGIWMPELAPADFLRLQQLAEVSIDSIGWSGGNTTVDALALGTPVVTLPGDTMRSRHSKAYLEQAGAEGLIARDADDFVALAADPVRQEKAMATLDPDALFNDLEPVRAVDAWMLSLFAE